MKQVKYFCDICGEERTDPKAEKDCIFINMNYTKSWETDLPYSELLQNIHVCKKCGTEINNIINQAKERKGFNSTTQQ